MCGASVPKLTVANVIRALEEAVQARGEDYVYYPPESSLSCQYVQEDDDGNDVPGCIVGFILVNTFDIPLEPFRTTCIAGVKLRELQNAGLLQYTEMAAKLLEKVQSYQDRRMPWGKAVDAGSREVLHMIALEQPEL